MPKKMGLNSRSEEAKARKSASEAEKKDRETKEKEEQYWKEAEEGGRSKATKKKEEEAEKKAEAAARKAEAKRIAEMEEMELEKASIKKLEKKANRVAISVPKVTEAELRRQREEEEVRVFKKAEEVKKKKDRLASEEEYEEIVLVTNTNRDDSIIEARSVEEALAKISVADTLPVDRHPEKRLKASFKVGFNLCSEEVRIFRQLTIDMNFRGMDFLPICMQLFVVPSQGRSVDVVAELSRHMRSRQVENVHEFRCYLYRCINY